MSKRVLVADDSLTIQKVVSLTFADEDVAIEAVGDGRLAIEKVRDLKPDLVLADVLMPGLNGYQVCEILKEDPHYRDIPVILLVGTFEPFDELEAARVGCDGHLTKPFDTSELLGLFHSFASRVATKPVESERVMSTDEVPVPADARKSDEVPLVSSKTRDSFLGSGSILDIFSLDLASGVPAREIEGTSLEEKIQPVIEAAPEPTAGYIEDNVIPASPTSKTSDSTSSQVIPFPGLKELPPGPVPAGLTEEVLDAIVERVVRRMSQETVREIAWEVVPELAEIIIRQRLNERDLAENK